MKSKSNGIKCRMDRSWWVILLAALLIPTACSDRNEPDTNVAGELQIRLLIDTQNPVSTRVDVTDDVSIIKELRVYVFNNQNKKIGYYYNGNLGASGNAYYIPMKLYEKGLLDFYVIANEGGAGIKIDENTTKDELEHLVFETKNIDTSKGFLMSGHKQQSIADDTGITVVECPLVRDFSLVDVYFAKSGSFDATVTKLLLTDYTTNDELHWNKNIMATWQRGFSTEPANLLKDISAPVIVEKIVSEEQQTSPDADYGTAITYPITTNPYGSESWDTTDPEMERKPCLNIEYTVNGTVRTATVYLPKVVNNYRYNVYCLIKASGVEFVLNVLPWEYEQKEIVWSKQYQFNFNVGKIPSEEGQDKYIEIKYTDNNDPYGSNDVLITFMMTGPEGTPWKASLSNGQDFYFYDEHNPDNLKYVPQGIATADAQMVTIRLKAREKFDEDNQKTTHLAIRVESPDQTEGWVRLPINKDKITSGMEDVIWIKQVANQ